MLAHDYDIQTRQSSYDDFDRARHRAMRNYLLATVSGRPRHPRSFGELGESIVSQVYRGMQTVRVAQIVGSVNRSIDFDAGFNPLHTHTRQRWETLALLMGGEMSVPPVELYKVGEHYYVKDGNHRVSVARFHSMEYIDAEVVELCFGAAVSYNAHRRTVKELALSLKALQPHPALPGLQALHRRPTAQVDPCEQPVC